MIHSAPAANATPFVHSMTEQQASLDRLHSLERLAQGALWADLARAWANPANRPLPMHWDLLRHSLRHAGPQTPADAPLADPLGWDLLKISFSDSSEWIRAGLEQCGFWCEKPFDHNLGWGVACLEMDILREIPEEKPESRHRLLSWLSRRHAPEAEMKRADSWGLPQDMQWHEHMILSVIWSGAEGFRGHDTTDEQAAARSRDSLQAFFDRGLIGADDIESSLKTMFREDPRASLRDAPGLCAYLAFDATLAEKAWRESRNLAAGVSWLDGAREKLREMEQKQRGVYFAARVVAAVEALELRVVVADSASAANATALSDPSPSQALAAMAKMPRL